MDKERRAALIAAAEAEPFRRLLGIEVLAVAEGYARCRMACTAEMGNIHGAVHGGAIFALIDEAFELSSNTRERAAVALNMTITYLKAPPRQASLVAESREVSRTRRTAVYQIEVACAEEKIALCQALVYITDKANPVFPETGQGTSSQQCSSTTSPSRKG